MCIALLFTFTTIMVINVTTESGPHWDTTSSTRGTFLHTSDPRTRGSNIEETSHCTCENRILEQAQKAVATERPYKGRDNWVPWRQSQRNII
jgi:hypothetical protein